jgi:hypothetical protein
MMKKKKRRKNGEGTVVAGLGIFLPIRAVHAFRRKDVG